MRTTLHAAAILALSIVAASTLAQPIRLHPANPNYFEYQGEPLALVTSAEHYGAVLNSDFDYIRYLDTLAADGMSYTRIFAGSYVEPQGAFGISRNTLAPAAGAFLPPFARSDTPGYANGGNKFDLTRYNPAYLARLHDFIDHAAQRGIIVELTLFCSTYNDRNWSISPFNPANNVNNTTVTDYHDANVAGSPLLPHQLALVRMLVTELNRHDNLFYELQNEPWADHTVTARVINPYGPNPAERWTNRADLAAQPALDWQDTITAAIVEAEASLPKRHLIAQNFCNFGYPLRDINPNVSILNFHYAWPEAAEWNRGHGRVVGYDESGFAGSEDATYRAQAWRFVLAGGGLFNSLDYSFYVGHEDGLGPNEAPGGGSKALRRQLAVLSRTLHDLDFIQMSPDHATVKLAPGCITRALSRSGSQYLIYIEGVAPATLTLDLPPGNYAAQWIDTRGESLHRPVMITAGNAPTKLTTPPFEGDIALTITRND